MAMRRGVLLLLTLCLLAGCEKGGKAVDLLTLDVDSYEPVEQFVPAYEAIENQQQLASGRDYDLEQTVRVLNALELAQAQSGSFDEFLDRMARQDYTGVAPTCWRPSASCFPCWSTPTSCKPATSN